MKIYRDRWEIITKAVRLVSEGIVTIYQLDMSDNRWGVNWSACGTRTTEETEGFIRLLNMGIDVADTLNRHEIEFPYTDDFDPEIDSKERYEEVGEVVTSWLKDGEYRKVEAWLLDGAQIYAEQNPEEVAKDLFRYGEIIEDHSDEENNMRTTKFKDESGCTWTVVMKDGETVAIYKGGSKCMK